MHRLHTLPNDLAAFFLALVPMHLAVETPLSLPGQMMAPNETMWERFIGDHGGMALSLFFGGIFLALYLYSQHRESARQRRLDGESREQKATEAKLRQHEADERDRRHQELVTSNAANVDKLIALTVDQAKASMMATAASQRVADKLERNNRLLAARYCLMDCNPMLRKVVSELVITKPNPIPDLPPAHSIQEMPHKTETSTQ